MYGLQKLTQNNAPICTLGEIKEHAILSSTIHFDDTLLEFYVEVATNTFELLTDLQLRPSTWKLTLDRLPSRDVIYIRKTPVQSVESITYYDGDNAIQTWDATNYILDTTQPIARVINVGNYPTSLSCRYKPLMTINFTAGSTTIDPTIRYNIMLYAAQCYLIREPIALNQTIATVPYGFEMYCNLHKVNYFGDWNEPTHVRLPHNYHYFY